MKLYTKFILSYLFYGIAGFAVIALLSGSLVHDYIISSRSSTLYDEATMIANSCSSLYDGKDVDLYSIKPQADAVAALLSSDVWIMDKNGTIRVDSSGKRIGTNIADFDPTATGNKSYMTGTYFNTFPYDVLSVSAPITGNYRTYGYVVIHLPLTETDADEYQILNIVYETGAIIFLLSFIILALMHYMVYRPLKKITEAARQYAARNFSYRIDISSQDELGYLAGTLNFMAEEMSRQDEYQHDFIANISHDFRSPLTSIKGYLEAILDGTIPPEQQNKYIERVIGETERLTKLTSGMLTLNTIDTQGQLSRTRFDINRVIKETAASFEGQCQSKGITFELTFDDDRAMVYADLSRIQQVLYNLIDNAIKFSYKDGTIYISTSHRKGKVYTSVKDTGIGIARKDQQKIFDRFYKTDSSRGRDKKGTGLGLAIVKDIIQSHNENIDVISTEGVGTEFVFSLASADENDAAVIS